MKAPALSMSMSTMLHAIGRFQARGDLYQVGNTNRTAEALEARGLIALVRDGRGDRASRTLCFAWELTPAGQAIVDERTARFERMRAQIGGE